MRVLDAFDESNYWWNASYYIGSDFQMLQRWNKILQILAKELPWFCCIISGIHHHLCFFVHFRCSEFTISLNPTSLWMIFVFRWTGIKTRRRPCGQSNWSASLFKRIVYSGTRLLPWHREYLPTSPAQRQVLGKCRTKWTRHNLLRSLSHFYDVEAEVNKRFLSEYLQAWRLESAVSRKVQAWLEPGHFSVNFL